LIISYFLAIFFIYHIQNTIATTPRIVATLHTFSPEKADIRNSKVAQTDT